MRRNCASRTISPAIIATIREGFLRGGDVRLLKRHCYTSAVNCSASRDRYIAHRQKAKRQEKKDIKHDCRKKFLAVQVDAREIISDCTVETMKEKEKNAAIFTGC